MALFSDFRAGITKRDVYRVSR